MKDAFFPTGKAGLAGVMGWPISHSKSPRLHGYWLKEHKIDGAYIPMPVPEGKIEQALRALPILGFKGCNITIPHKEEAMKCVEEIHPLARRVGAVNTIVVKEDGKLEGRNTDVFGFMENLKQAGFTVDPKNPIATVLGAGGAARAIVVGLQEFGFQEIRIVNRSPSRAEAMIKSIGGETKFQIVSFEERQKALKGASLLVNTTSLGMTGHDPLEIDLSALPQGAWVTDAVYAPLETGLLKQARQKGFFAVDGLGMLLHQAREGFSLWFGKDPEVTQKLRDYVLQT